MYLNALYDMALSFEHSPLIGCTTFTFGADALEGGGGILARAFDFEVDEVFDRHKAVFLVQEAGQIPFASVAWPGLVGVVSGMNAEGVAIVVHGARGGAPQAEGEPVVHALRRVLSTAHDSDEALRALAEQPAMVSHILILNDQSGRARGGRARARTAEFRALSARKGRDHESLRRPSRPQTPKISRCARTPRPCRAAVAGDELLARLPARAQRGRCRERLG